MMSRLAGWVIGGGLIAVAAVAPSRPSSPVQLLSSDDARVTTWTGSTGAASDAQSLFDRDTVATGAAGRASIAAADWSAELAGSTRATLSTEPVSDGSFARMLSLEQGDVTWTTTGEGRAYLRTPLGLISVTADQDKPTPTPSASASPSPSASPAPSASPSQSPKPTPKPTQSPKPTPPKPTPTSTVKPTPKPTPSITPKAGPATKVRIAFVEGKMTVESEGGLVELSGNDAHLTLKSGQRLRLGYAEGGGRFSIEILEDGGKAVDVDLGKTLLHLTKGDQVTATVVGEHLEIRVSKGVVQVTGPDKRTSEVGPGQTETVVGGAGGAISGSGTVTPVQPKAKRMPREPKAQPYKDRTDISPDTRDDVSPS